MNEQQLAIRSKAAKLQLEDLQDPNQKLNIFDNLIEYGQNRGFVTFEDVINYFPTAEEDENLLEDAYSALESAGYLAHL